MIRCNARIKKVIRFSLSRRMRLLFDKSVHDDSWRCFTVERAKLVTARQTLWLPVEYTSASSVGFSLRFTDYT